MSVENSAWKAYQEIETVMINGCKRFKVSPQIFASYVELIHEAIVVKFKLAGSQYKPNREMRQSTVLRINEERVRSTNIRVDSLFRLEIFKIDDDNERAGYCRHRSLESEIQQTFGCDYATFKIMALTTSEQVWATYHSLEQTISIEVKRLEANPGIITNKKVTAINAALQRLTNVIGIRYPEQGKLPLDSQVDEERVAGLSTHLHFHNAETMLKAQIGLGKSLNDALDIARNNPFNLVAEYKTLWGKSRSLENVLNAVNNEKLSKEAAQ